MEMIVDVRDVIALAQRSQQAPTIIKEELTMALQKSGLAVTGDAKELAPIDEGYLRDSITPEIKYPNVVVSSDKQYAPTMEFGREKGKPMPPDGPIRAWAYRVGILDGVEESKIDGVVFLIRRAISKNGITGRRFMRGALEKNRTRIQSFFQLAGANIARRVM